MKKSYSVAIRTLGLAKDKIKEELESIYCQTILPEKVVLYIAEGYERPEFTIGNEIYVTVPKGMMRQRALDYKEIDSDYILMLDDDMRLSDNAVEILLSEMERTGADCMAYDICANHKWSPFMKLRAAIMRLEMPHLKQKWAFKMHGNGSFSYLNKPSQATYPSQSAAGGVSLWKKDAFLKTKFQDEVWLDDLKFPYAEDELLFYKLFINGGKLYVNFTADILHLDGRSARNAFNIDSRRFRIRAASGIIRWHRMMYLTTNSSSKRMGRGFSMAMKILWMTCIQFAMAIATLRPSTFTMHVRGLQDALKFIKSDTYKNLPPFKKESVRDGL